MTVNRDRSHSSSSEEEGPRLSRAEEAAPSAVSNPEAIITMEEELKPPKKWIKGLRLSVPHINLLLFTCAFIALIAFTMQWAESDHEREQDAKLRAQIERVHAEFVALIVVPEQHRPSADLEARIRALEVQLMRLGWAKGRAGVPLPVETAPENTSANAVWTVPNSFLFATSLLARIGYGHMVPLTPLGKVLSQLFAIFGIPLFFILIADLAIFYSIVVQALAMHMPRVRCIVIKPPAAQKNAVQQDSPRVSVNYNEAIDSYISVRPNDRTAYLYALHAALFALFCAATAALYRQMEGWDWLDSAYFVFSSFFCIGFGDFAPSSAHSAWITIGAIFLGLIPLNLFIDTAGTGYCKKIHLYGRSFSYRVKKVIRKRAPIRQ